jgi:hypothetical protein
VRERFWASGQSGETLARTLKLSRVSAGIADCTSALQKKALSSRYEQNVIVTGMAAQAWLSQKVVIPECDGGVFAAEATHPGTHHHFHSNICL